MLQVMKWSAKNKIFKVRQKSRNFDGEGKLTGVESCWNRQKKVTGNENLYKWNKNFGPTSLTNWRGDGGILFSQEFSNLKRPLH